LRHVFFFRGEFFLSILKSRLSFLFGILRFFFCGWLNNCQIEFKVVGVLSFIFQPVG
jgi:hypothetical protein